MCPQVTVLNNDFKSNLQKSIEKSSSESSKSEDSSDIDEIE